MIEITKTERKDNNKGPWLVIEYLNEKGEAKTANTFENDIIAQYKGPGKYEATWKKKGNYWNLAKLEPLFEAKSDTKPQVLIAKEVKPEANVRLDVASKAVTGALLLVDSLMKNGGYKDADIDDVLKHVDVASKFLFGTFQELINPSGAKTKKEEKAVAEGA